MSNLNKTAIREHALACSAAHRNNRFTRVGEDFYEEIEADVEKWIRDLEAKHAELIHPAVPTDASFVPGPLADKIRDTINRAIARLIQAKVARQPSVGCTLGRTR